MRGADPKSDRLFAPFRPNGFGLGEAIGGFAVGIILATIAVTIFGVASGHPRHPSNYGSDVVDLLGLWTGLAGCAIVASSRARAGEPAAERVGLGRRLAEDYGFSLRPWPDIPLGIAVGLFSQYVLVFVFELPLLPFVPHLYSRLSQPAVSLTGDATGVGVVALGVLVCLGSPVVEELFFRGVLFRSVTGRLARLGPRLGPVLSALIVGLAFGLAHFEPLELIALAGFGAVLCALAWWTGRLGAGIVAHVSFNVVAFISVVRSH